MIPILAHVVEWRKLIDEAPAKPLEEWATLRSRAMAVGNTIKAAEDPNMNDEAGRRLIALALAELVYDSYAAAVTIDVNLEAAIRALHDVRIKGGKVEPDLSKVLATKAPNGAISWA